MMKIKNSQNIALLFICFFLAAVFLAVCSRSSFLYPCNDWNDANSYFTMGKAMMNGKVIYRDLYDQKGPYLYLLYGIAWLIYPTSFAGVFVLETVAIGLFLFFAYKILTLYCRRSTGLILLPVLAAVTLSSKSFYFGGAAEEFCLPLLEYSLYESLKYFKNQKGEEPKAKMLLLNGVAAGIVMQVKYTMLGFYFAWIVLLLLPLLFQKKIKKFVAGGVCFAAGMFSTLLPWLIYFGINGALDDWYQCYIYNNIFLYSDIAQGENGIGKKIYDLAKILLWLIVDNRFYFFFIITGAVYFLLSAKIRWLEKINVFSMMAFLFLGIYVGGSDLPYYSIPLMAFAVLGLILAGLLIERMWKKELPVFLISVTVISGVFFAGHFSMNTYFMDQKREDYFLYKFKKIIEQDENPTLVTIGCLDAGLYTVTGIIPDCRFFQTNGIAFDEMFKEQDRYVKEGVTSYILTRDYEPPGIEEKYELLAQEPYQWGGIDFMYALYRRK